MVGTVLKMNAVDDEQIANLQVLRRNWILLEGRPLLLSLISPKNGSSLGNSSTQELRRAIARTKTGRRNPAQTSPKQRFRDGYHALQIGMPKVWSNDP